MYNENQHEKRRKPDFYLTRRPEIRSGHLADMWQREGDRALWSRNATGCENNYKLSVHETFQIVQNFLSFSNFLLML
ncbi:hypothetical protein HanHA300_Chr02g0043961 [Helianthus annuus]|nr:hypothetical protein HanHA300_Chr02g0043961 [Helianthus annuus]KAJ0617938.1 hypothetical protein HanHA89_Chr02g0047441 [Helianthus annuus]